MSKSNSVFALLFILGLFLPKFDFSPDDQQQILQALDPCITPTITQTASLTPIPSRSATSTTVALKTFTPSYTPTRDYSQSPIFQTATAINLATLHAIQTIYPYQFQTVIAYARQTERAKQTSSPNWYPSPTLEDLRTPSVTPFVFPSLIPQITPSKIPTVTPPSPTVQRYTIVVNSVNIRQSPSLNGQVIGGYFLGNTVFVTDTQEANGYVWRKSDRGWIATHSLDGTRINAKLQ